VRNFLIDAEAKVQGALKILVTNENPMGTSSSSAKTVLLERIIEASDPQSIGFHLCIRSRRRHLALMRTPLTPFPI